MRILREIPPHQSVIALVVILPIRLVPALALIQSQYHDYQARKMADSVFLFSTSDPFRIVQGNVMAIINKNDVMAIDGAGCPDGAK